MEALARLNPRCVTRKPAPSGCIGGNGSQVQLHFGGCSYSTHSAVYWLLPGKDHRWTVYRPTISLVSVRDYDTSTCVHSIAQLMLCGQGWCQRAIKAALFPVSITTSETAHQENHSQQTAAEERESLGDCHRDAATTGAAGSSHTAGKPSSHRCNWFRADWRVRSKPNISLHLHAWMRLNNLLFCCIWSCVWFSAECCGAPLQVWIKWDVLQGLHRRNNYNHLLSDCHMRCRLASIMSRKT